VFILSCFIYFSSKFSSIYAINLTTTATSLIVLVWLTHTDYWCWSVLIAQHWLWWTLVLWLSWCTAAHFEVFVFFLKVFNFLLKFYFYNCKLGIQIQYSTLFILKKLESFNHTYLSTENNNNNKKLQPFI
jgi:hypothetical protein